MCVSFTPLVKRSFLRVMVMAYISFKLTKDKGFLRVDLNETAMFISVCYCRIFIYSEEVSNKDL